MEESNPYLILDARYEKVRLDGVIQSQAVLVAIGINSEGRRQVLGVELSNRESHSNWKAFVSGLKTRGLEADDDCRQEPRWLYDRRNLKEAQQDLQAWLQRWERRYPMLTDWVKAHIGETLNFYRLPRQHHKHLKSTNLLERLNEEIKRRTRMVRIFPNPAICLRHVQALCAETHEGWLEDHRYLNRDFLKEQKKDLLQAAA